MSKGQQQMNTYTHLLELTESQRENIETKENNYLQMTDIWQQEDSTVSSSPEKKNGQVRIV